MKAHALPDPTSATASHLIGQSNAPPLDARYLAQMPHNEKALPAEIWSANPPTNDHASASYSHPPRTPLPYPDRLPLAHARPQERPCNLPSTPSRHLAAHSANDPDHRDSAPPPDKTDPCPKSPSPRHPPQSDSPDAEHFPAKWSDGPHACSQSPACIHQDAASKSHTTKAYRESPTPHAWCKAPNISQADDTPPCQNQPAQSTPPSTS